MSRSRVAGLAAATLLVLAGCTGTPTVAPTGPTSAPLPTPAPVRSAAPVTTPTPAIAEPTTTNTLPPPPEPSAPAPSTAGPLDADALPVPAGWRRATLPGGGEEGFRGNGTWVHARDPRYAAQDVITIGCADVTRDDYPDPIAALEGNYTGTGGAPGVGLALQFADADAAARYWERYTAQVDACRTPDAPVQIERVEGLPGLVDRRTYPDSRWTEVGRRTGARVTLIILSDGQQRLSVDRARALLAQLG